MKSGIWKYVAMTAVAIVMTLGGIIWTGLEARIDRVETQQKIIESDIALERAAKRLADLEKRGRCGRTSDDYETCEELKRRIKRLGGQITTLEGR